MKKEITTEEAVEFWLDGIRSLLKLRLALAAIPDKVWKGIMKNKIIK